MTNPQTKTCDLCTQPPAVSIRVAGAPVPETLCSNHAQRRRTILDAQLMHYQTTAIGERVTSAEEQARQLSSHVSQLSQDRRQLRSRVDQAEGTMALLEEQIIKRNEMIDNLSSELRRSEAQRRKLADLLQQVGTEHALAEARTLGLLEAGDAQRVDGDTRDTDPPTAE